MIWASLQVFIYLMLGYFQEMKNYSYITKEVRHVYLRKIRLLEKFFNMITKNPHVFDKKETPLKVAQTTTVVREDEKPNGEQLPTQTIMETPTKEEEEESYLAYDKELKPYGN
jgi:hypothetical protein